MRQVLLVVIVAVFGNLSILPGQVAATVAIYKDTGVWEVEGSRTLPAAFEWLGHRWQFVSAQQIDQGILHKNGKPAFDLFVVPGGWAWDYIVKVGGANGAGKGDDQVRSFVAKGGGYLGFCAGAFAACSTTRWLGRDYAYTWHLLDGRAEGPLSWNALRRGGWLRAGHGTAALDRTTAELKSCGLPATVRPMLYGGPRFVLRDPTKPPLQWRVLATHGEDKSAAIVAFRYGSKTGGRVVLSSFHPTVLTDDAALFDRDADDFAWALGGKDPDAGEFDWRLFAALVDAALDRPSRKAPPLPRKAGSVQVAATAAMGKPLKIQLQQSGQSGAVFQLAASGNVAPGIGIAGTQVPLTLDSLFLASLTYGVRGKLNATGQASVSVQVPVLPALRGRVVYLAFVTAPAGKLTASAPARTVLR